MRDNGIRDTIGTLIDTDPTCLDRTEVGDVMRLIRHVHGWADAALLECTRRLDQLAREADSTNPEAETSATLTNLLDQPDRQSAAIVNQAGLCDHNTGLEDSLAAGEITTHHLDLIARYRDKLNDVERSDFDLEADQMRELARCQNLKMFESSLKSIVERLRLAHRPDDDGEAELEHQRQSSGMKSWVERDTGLHKFLLSMDPIRAAKFTSAYRAELAAVRNQNQQTTTRDSFGCVQIDAIMNAMSGGLAAQRSTELVVIVDHQTLTGGRHEQSVCETLDGDRLPVPTVQHLSENAIFNLFATDQSGDITAAVDQRTATRQQRRALAALYRTCAFPECSTGISNCRMHHVAYYSRGGETKIDNLLPLCETHHHYIHDQGWGLTLDTGDRHKPRCATFTTPTGDRNIETYPDRQRRRPVAESVP